ncbi:hypothetical protein BDK51DRAFT_23526 [Blyttiomyces helicus]|uniref:FCP1 homology domain-containing protein n=1 Tax=Blyttiomyces helicus TaxID=388810 RepID=A0A4P9WJQ7_9FUNG|nr:hypothetical protein BDK51DRAFT_23526 [Blyttiomyces helicus]|eukprot:RKO92193.1 hypothetical protein BDK51DRAFT_23526 [Blyttiomyces helicus]
MDSRKLLVVLDLNGTLLARLQNRKEHKSERVAYQANPTVPKPYLDTFVMHLIESPEFEVAVWTSAGFNNATAMVMGTFGSNTEKLSFTWNRTQCSDVASTTEDHSSKKDLRKIWDDPVYNAEQLWSEVRRLLMPPKLCAKGRRISGRAVACEQNI